MYNLLPQKFQGPSTNIFSVMSAAAQAHAAINLSQGFPDFPIDEKLIHYYTVAARQGYNQYAPMAGVAGLQEAIAADVYTRWGIDLDPRDEITITPGATYAIYTALSCVLSPGDEVIVFEPAYDSYIPNILLNGARPVTVPLVGDEFKVDWQKLEEAISPRTRVIVVNTPHNPSGTLWTKYDWERLAALIRDKTIYIVADEVYEQLVYDDELHCSVCSIPELRAKAFALFSFGKVLHNTGWKIGYAIAPAELSAAFRKIHQYLSFSVHTPAQYAIMHYLNDAGRVLPAPVLQAKRDYFYRQMQDSPFRLLRPASGSYFQLVSYEGLSDEKDTDFSLRLVREAGVAAIPLSPFYADYKHLKLLRFCFAKLESTLDKAAERLRGWRP